MKKLIFAVLIFFAFVIHVPYIAQASPLAYSTERLSGQDRIETALKIAQKGWDSAQTVILCEYTDYPDSIAAAPFAVSLNAPILLTGGKTIDERVVNELQRLKPQNVIMLGGQGCLGVSIEKELDNLSLKWERIGGTNRYETSVLLASRLNSDSLIIANGDDFADALSAASYAGIQQIPIVLTSKTLPASVLKYWQENKPQHIIVIGGEAVVPSSSLTQAGLSIETRLGGQNRYETNAAVVAYMQGAMQTQNLFLASGQTFADAVTGTVLAAKQKAPLLLVSQEDIPPAVYRIMRENMQVEPSSVTAQSGKGKVTASGGLYLRDTPSSAGKLLLTIPEGTTLDITAAQGQWYQTTYQNKNGWVSANHVDVFLSYKQGRITASGGLNLRETPSTTAKVLTTIPERATVTIIEEGGDWIKTDYRGTSGWLYAEYVSILPGNSAGGSDGMDLSPNGLVYVLGGTGVISAHVQSIIEGKAESKYPDNLKDFPGLPASLNAPNPQIIYDPTKEVLLDPFQGIPANALLGKKILIDPGHGGRDTGAIGPNGTFEKDNNLAVALYLNDILKEAGATVSLTRTTDVSIIPNYSERDDLQARVNIANSNKPDLFISIHHNANTNPDKNGTTTYFSRQNPKASESAKLAEKIQNSIVRAVDTVDDGAREMNFFVLRYTTMPSVLVEVAYISNPYEEARQRNPIFQKNVATAIFHGIYGYYKD